MERIDERNNFIVAEAAMTDEDREFINKHLDMAFEGRHDYLRFSY